MDTGATMFIQGIGLAPVSVPLYTVYLRSGLVTGPVVVGARPILPVQGISLLLGNDLAGSKVIPGLAVDNKPKLTKDVDKLDTLIPGFFLACVVTRAAARQAASKSNHTTQSEQSDGGVPSPRVADETSLKDVHDKGTACTTDDHVNVEAIKCTREQLFQAQEEDPELHPLIDDVVGEEEVHKYANCFYRQSGVLNRKWRPPKVPANEEWQMSHQIVLPWKFREEVLSIVHASPMTGHLGVNKTYCKLLKNFYWPKLKRDVAQFCRTCHVCQVVGKLNQPIPVALLKPVLAYGKPFSDNLSIRLHITQSRKEH